MPRHRPKFRRPRRNQTTYHHVVPHIYNAPNEQGSSDISDVIETLTTLTVDEQNPSITTRFDSPACSTTDSISTDLSVPVEAIQSDTANETLLLRIKHYLENTADVGTFMSCLDKLVTFVEAKKPERGVIGEVLCVLFDNLQNGTGNMRTFLKNKLKDLHCEMKLKRMEIHPSKVTRTMTSIGEGQFGVITLGYLKAEDTCLRQKVALKTSHFWAMECPENEAKIMVDFDHLNIVKLLGILTEPEYTLIIEYCQLKDLSSAIKQVNFTDEELLKCLVDISSGMEYIAEKKYVHRDLALRNVFVTSAKVCKLGDFGVCRKTDGSDGGTEYESIRVDKFIAPPGISLLKDWSWHSDVWSMGILVWSMYYIASNKNNPVELHMSMIAIISFRLYNNEARFEKPSRCPVDLHNYVNNRLLNRNPKRRPPFTEIKEWCVRYLRLNHP